MPSSSSNSSSHSRDCGDWQRAFSPAPTGYPHGSVSPPPIDPFFGQYPNAPHLRPIELPQTPGSRAPRGLDLMNLAPTPAPRHPGISSPGPGPGSSHSRPISLPPPINSPASFVYGMSPPNSPQFQSQITVHPLLRGSADGGAGLIYNVLASPSLSGPNAIRHPTIRTLNHFDLSQTATNPAHSSLRVSLSPCANPHAAPFAFPWTVALTPSRRTSSPGPGQAPAITIFDALASLHISLLTAVGDNELQRFSPAQLSSAQAAHTQRLQSIGANGGASQSLIRADFLYGCILFGGFIRNPDNTLSIRLSQI